MGNRRGVVLALLVVVSLSLVSLVTPSVAQRPDEGPVSQILQDAFFTNSVASGGRSYRGTDDLGPRMRRFHPERDDKLVFVGVFNPSHSVTVRGVLIRPDGRQHGTLSGDLSSRPSGTWQSKSWSWAMAGLKPYQGEWQLQLWVNEQPIGNYYFMLGEAAARVPSGWAADSRTGCRVWNERPMPDETVTWSGACSSSGLAVGHGVEEFRYGGNVSRYEGEFLDGKKHGTGTKTWPNGNRYVGEWREGRAHGKGVFTMSSGRFDGEWNDGCFRDGDRRAGVGRPPSECS